LILLKSGGHLIYSGPLGQHSSSFIEYFEKVPILEVTSTSAEAELGVDFALKYRESALYESNFYAAEFYHSLASVLKSIGNGLVLCLSVLMFPQWEILDKAATYNLGNSLDINDNSTGKNNELVRQLSSPPPDSRDLYFPTRFSQNGWGQFKFCLWKQHLAYRRSPAYNLMRIIHTLISALIFGVLYWNQGKNLINQQNVFNIAGSMYVSVIFLGINNCSTVLPYCAAVVTCRTQALGSGRYRTVMYRERFVGMYSSWAYSLAQVIVEVPYIFTETVIFVTIIYPMIGYYGSAYKVFWYFYVTFCSLLYFNYLGMLLVSFTPNFMVAAILYSSFYTIFNLFAGFLIPKPQIPKWWIWLYYLIPTSWSLNGLLTSQYGDINKDIVVFGQTKTVVAFLREYFGFHHDQLAIVAVVLIAFPIFFASLFAYFIGRLNFQRR
ncbi:pleiotropic drug resistance protein 3-like, partial [Fagus crenata]